MTTVVELKCNASPLVDEQGNSVTEVGTITVADGKATFSYLVVDEVPSPAYARIAVTSAMDFLGKDFIITFTGIQHSNYSTNPYVFATINGNKAYFLLVSGLSIIFYYLVDLVPVGDASWEYNDMEQDFFVTAPRNLTLSRTSKSLALAIEGKTTTKVLDSLEGTSLDSMDGGNLYLGVYSEVGGAASLYTIIDNFKLEIDGGTPPAPSSSSGGGYKDKKHFQRF